MGRAAERPSCIPTPSVGTRKVLKDRAERQGHKTGVLLLIAFCFVPAPLHAAQPALRTLEVRGLQVGAKTTLVLDGDELGKAPRLLFPFAAQQTLKPGGTDKRAAFEVIDIAAVDDAVSHRPRADRAGEQYPGPVHPRPRGRYPAPRLHA